MAAAASYLQVPSTQKEFVGWQTTFKLVRNLLKGDEKFFTVKLSNPKIQERVVSVYGTVDYLVKIGFVKDDANQVLKFQGTPNVDTVNLEMKALENLLGRYSAANNENKSSQKVDVTLLSRSSKSQVRAKEEAMRKEKRRQEQMQKKALLKKFEADKKARAQPGWEAKVSAARSKTGAAINKFDDTVYNT